MALFYECTSDPSSRFSASGLRMTGVMVLAQQEGRGEWYSLKPGSHGQWFSVRGLFHATCEEPTVTKAVTVATTSAEGANPKAQIPSSKTGE